MAVVYGAYTSYIPYLNSDFFVEERKAYDLDDPTLGPVLAQVMKQNPGAFRDTPDPVQPPPVEQATAAPGEVRKTKWSSRG